MSSKELKNPSRYQSPISQQKTVSGERKHEDFTSPITQWLSSPFCQLDILSPNDGSLAFSMSSPVQLSPYLPTTTALTKSPGGFSPSIFSSYKESAYFDDHESSHTKAERITDFDHDDEGPSSSKLTLFGESTRPTASSFSGNVLKKSSLYGRQDKLTDRYTRVTDSNTEESIGRGLGVADTADNEGSLSSTILSGVVSLGRGNRGESGHHIDRVLESPSESVSPDLTQSSRHHRSFRTTASSSSSGGRTRGSTSTTTTNESLGSDMQSSGSSIVGTVTSTDDMTKCNCKKSKCLKLYCECFVGMKYCGETCRCRDCYNNTDHDSQRQEAIRITKTRNGTAFQAKVSPALKVHMNGCNCKQSQCLKKYCECFTGAALCGSNCKCTSCQNFSGSESLIIAKRQLHEPVPTHTSGSNGLPRVIGVGGTVVSGKYDFGSGSSSIGDVAAIAFDDYDQNVDLFDDAFVVPAATTATAGARDSVRDVDKDQHKSQEDMELDQDTAMDCSSERVSVDSMNLVGSSRKRSLGVVVSTGLSTEAGLMQQNQSQSNSKAPPHGRSTRSSVKHVQIGMENDGGGSNSRMGTRGSLPRGIAVAPGSSNPTIVMDGGGSAEQKSKARRLTSGTSPSGVTDLLSVISPLAMQSSVETVSASLTHHKAINSSTSQQHQQQQQQKKKPASASTTNIVYPFFGEKVPATPKIIALRCLEFLDGPSLYNMSMVNTLWCKAAMDDALWE